MKNSPLPYPAEEIRNACLDSLNSAALDLGRLTRFFRGHQRDCRMLSSIQVTLLSMQMSLAKLGWNTSTCEQPFSDPPKPSVNPSDTPEEQPDPNHDQPPPTPALPS